MPDPASLIGLALAAGSPSQGLELALAAAKAASERATRDNPHPIPAERPTVALWTADDVLEGPAVEVEGEGPGGPGAGGGT